MNQLTKAFSLCVVVGSTQILPLVAAAPAQSFEQILQSSQNLPEDQRYQVYTDLLNSAKMPSQKALVYAKLADLYLGIRDKTEALNQLNFAVVADPDNKAITTRRDQLQEEIFPTPTRLQRFREANQDRHLFIDVSLGLEYANNVIQESVNPAKPTNKEDTSLVFNGFASYDPTQQIMGGLNQSVQYSLASYTYFDHSSLNLLNNNLEYHLLDQKTLKSGTLNLDRVLGFSHVHSDESSLLWTAKLGYGGSFAANNGMTYDAGLDLSNTEYFDSLYSTEEGWGWNSRMGLGRNLDKDQQQNLHLGLSYLGEDLDAEASSYYELGARLTYAYTFNDQALQSISPYLGVKSRHYDGIDVGATEARKDDRWEVGIDAVVSFADSQRWTASLSTLENDSNISAYHYRNTQVSLKYGISF